MRRSADFRDVIRRGRRRHSRSLVVSVLDNVDDESRTPRAASTGPLVGFVVGRAVGPAVVRNLVKRRLRHSMRRYLSDAASGGTWSGATRVVIQAKPGSAGTRWADLDAELGRSLSLVQAPARGSADGQRDEGGRPRLAQGAGVT